MNTRTEKQRLVLIHARVGKQQRRIIHGHTGGRGPKGVPVLFGIKVKKSRSDLVHGPLVRFSWHSSHTECTLNTFGMEWNGME